MGKQGWLAIGIAALIFTFTAGVLPAFSGTQTVFGPEDFTIGRWHLLLSRHSFDVSEPGTGLLRIRNNTPDKKIIKGFVVLNRKLILPGQLREADNTVFEKEVRLKARNRFTVFLLGKPGTSVNIEILAQGINLPPKIIAFTAKPSSIHISESSTLSWQTENAESCTIEPGGIAVGPNGSASFSPIDTTTYTLTVVGTGDAVTAQTTVTVVNTPPVAIPQSLTTAEDESIDISLSGSDADNDHLTYKIDQQPGHGIISGILPDISYTPDADYNGLDEFSFFVNDGTENSQFATIQITIQPVNDMPTANAGADQTVMKGDTVRLNGGDSSDADGDDLTYQWTFKSVPAQSQVSFSDSTTIDPTFVPDQAGVYEIGLIVNDGTVDSPEDTVAIDATPRMITVPNLQDMDLLAAQTTLAEADLTIGSVSEENNDTIAMGRIISHEPAAGTTVEEGSPINLIVSLGPQGQPPTVNLAASPLAINPGESARLSWMSYNGQNAHMDNDLGSVPVRGELNVSPEHTTTYTITVIGPTGSADASVTVKVNGQPLPQPEGSFGRQYEDLIPRDATLEEYDPQRFALITGAVKDIHGSPLADVGVTIHGHPEYGTVATDVEGRFSIPVEGGGWSIVVYQKKGFIQAQRKVYVPWNETAVAETVVIIAEDGKASTITFDGNADTVVTHQSSLVSDETGPRSVTMVLTGDNQAYLVNEKGNDVQPLATITTRATEYTTPEAMPAKLPPNSAFTYCAEFGVDGARRVRFEKPVITWVDNFLGFPVGEIVPVGYYNRDKGEWEPLENGLVVKLLDRDADGIVDALDADGDDLPNDLDGDGTFSSEVQGLDDSQLYAAGATFWRTALSHFSPIDFNWPFGFAADASPPNADGLAATDAQIITDQAAGENLPGNVECISSYVQQRSRVYHEDIPIPGTDITLHYSGNRVAGYKPGVITIPASGDSVPDTLLRIIVKVSVAGKTYEVDLPAAPNQMAEIEWDGLDYLGRPVTGTVIAYVDIGFVYYGVYYSAGRNGPGFGQAGIGSLTIPTRQELTMWRNVEIPIARATGTIAEGWTISAHHQLSPLYSSVLFKGDGSISRNNVKTIETIAGNGIEGFSGDNGPATSANIDIQGGIAVDAEGNIYFANYRSIGFHYNSSLIRKIDKDGIISSVASGLDVPHGLAVDAQGNIYFSEHLKSVVKKLDPDGNVTTIAGGGSGGDGGPATQANLWGPKEVALDADGNLYITDFYQHRLRKVDTNGIITTIAGNGARGNSGDGGLAIGAQLTYPEGVAVDRQGNVYVTSSRVVRKIDTSGIISTVAGVDGWSGSTSEGIPATEAQLYSPCGLDVDASGNLYIAEIGGSRIRKVNTLGIITTAAGAGPVGWGNGGYKGDGGPAVLAWLNQPIGVAVDPAGNIIILDWINHRIRRISSPAAGLKQLMAETDIAFTEESGIGHLMSYSGQHKMTIDLDSGKALRSFAYDSDDSMVSILDRFGNAITIERDGIGVPTAIVSADCNRTALNIDSNNHLTRITYSDGSFYEFEYTADGLMTAEIEPTGNRFEHFFDDQGRLTDVIDEEGGHWRYARSVDESGNVRVEMTTAENNLSSFDDHTDSTGAYTSTVTDASGAQTTYSRSDDGLSVNKALPCGTDVTLAYDIDPEYKYKYLQEMTEAMPSGLARLSSTNRSYEDTDTNDLPDLITETFAVNGKTTSLENNTIAARKTITSPEGRTVVSLYDPNTLLTSKVSVTGLHDTSYGYDARGRLTSVGIGNRLSGFSYNVEGLLESITDAEDRTTTYNYDPLGRITGITRPDNSFLDFTYDANGNMTVLTNPVGVDHGFGYNKVNNKSSYTTPLSGSYSYVYDKDRRLIQKNVPSGRRIENVYDSTQLIQVQTPEGDIDFTYYCGDKVESITKGTESIAYTYDGSLLTSETLTGTLNKSITYSYNSDFLPTSLAYAGDTETYLYDNDGLLTKAGDFSINRNAGNGLPVAVETPGLNINRQFNGYGELDEEAMVVGSAGVGSWRIENRDDTGRILSKTETVAGASSYFAYTYDTMGRLLSVTRDGELVEEYRYDVNGTRIFERNELRGITGRVFEYSDEDHLLSAGDATYQYTYDGFLARKTVGPDVTDYSYSSRGELLRVDLPDGRIVEYDHDPLGRRIAKKVNSSIVYKYLWQGLTKLLAVYDGSDNLLIRFEYADARMPVAMEKEGMKYYLLYDQVGSLRVVADAAGNVVKRIDYDSFGNIVGDSDVSLVMPLGFAGGLHDRDTELVRFGHRNYDPNIGRWSAKDPILFGGGDTDLYSYVYNNPVNLIDPFGLWGITYGGSLMGMDFSATLYDSNKGWFPSTTTDIGVSTTAFGGGLQFTFDTPVDSRSCPDDDLNVSLGVLSKYLGVTYNTELSRGSVNIGLGLGLPISFSTPIKNFAQGLGNTAQKIFK